VSPTVPRSEKYFGFGAYSLIMRPSTRSFWQWIIALFFIIAGANHFLNPGPYLDDDPVLPALARRIGVGERRRGGGGWLGTAPSRPSVFFSAWD